MNFKAHMSESPSRIWKGLNQPLLPTSPPSTPLPDKTSHLLTEDDEWTCQAEARQEKASAAPFSGRHHTSCRLSLRSPFCRAVSLSEDFLPFVSPLSDKASAPADRSSYALAPPIAKLMRSVKCQPEVSLRQTVRHTHKRGG